MNQKKYFAEIIESSFEDWTVQSWDWQKFPAFGTLVVVESIEKKLFAIVHQIKTGSMDSIRQPTAYQKTHEELIAEQPQIFEFLKTNFSCLILGYQEQNKIFYTLCPKPPKIHDFVRLATNEETINFFQNTQYLQVLFGQAKKLANIDELLLVILKNLRELKILNKNYFEDFIDQFSLINNNEYHKLRLFLQRANFDTL